MPITRPIAHLTRLLLTALIVALTGASAAQAFDTRASSAFVVDYGTGTVLLDKNADEPLPPASMSKLMTLLVTFEAIRDGRLSMQEELPVSAHAMSYGGSTMFLDTTDRVTVSDLIQGIIVLSGNDACAVLAEALSPDGTEAGFARFMTQRAQQLGMTNSRFANSNGWPDPGHRMSMRDLALLARHLIEDFPEFYPMFAQREFAFDGRAPQNKLNRNPLLGLGIGADGLKTGHTQEAGYGLVGSAVQGGRRVIFVISGLPTAQARAEEAESIVNWAFRQFAEKKVLSAGTELARAKVFMGAEQSVGLVPAADLTMLLPVLAGGELAAEVVVNSPLHAPIAEGAEVGHLVISPPDLPDMRVPLVAARAIERGGFTARMRTATQHLIDKIGTEAEEAL